MREASPVKFYFAKYFFLAFGLLQWIICLLIISRHGEIPRSQFAAFVFFTMGLTFISVFVMISHRIKRVAIGKNKIIIHKGKQEERVEWPEIKSIKNIPYVNMYKLKVKGQKEIYFFPDSSNQAPFGMTASAGQKKGKDKD